MQRDTGNTNNTACTVELLARDLEKSRRDYHDLLGVLDSTEDELDQYRLDYNRLIQAVNIFLKELDTYRGQLLPSVKNQADKLRNLVTRLAQGEVS
ncbi:hypothetical protein ACU6QD_10725 [Corynebacterium glucuronolyticum]